MFPGSGNHILNVAYTRNGTNFNAKDTKDIQDSCLVYPVKLYDFSLSEINEKIELTWFTDQEIDNYGFEIQHRNMKGKWEKISFVKEKGTSSSIQNYWYIYQYPKHRNQLLSTKTN